MEFPLREAYRLELDSLKERLSAGGLELLDDGFEEGTEEWDEEDCQGIEPIMCWWGVWAWPQDDPRCMSCMA